jgi:hypothetical protein
MITVSVQADITAITRRLQASAKQSRTAGARALNRTAARVRTYSAREIRQAGYNIKANAIKQNITIQKASPAVLAATVVASGKEIALIDYGAKGSKRNGVAVRVKNGTKRLTHAFIVVMPNGHRGVFERVGSARGHAGISAHRVRGGGDKRSGRLPIAELFGPGVPQAFANGVVQKNLETNAREYFPIELTRELKFLLGGS